MSFKRNVAGAAAVAIAMIAGQASAGIIMDFQDLEAYGGGFTEVGYSYIAGDFEVWHDVNEPFGFRSPHVDNGSFYQGSTGLFNDTVGGITVLDRLDGAPFDMESIDLAGLFVGGGDTTVLFTGYLNGGGTVQTSFTTSNGGYGFETFSFAGLGFNNLDSLQWSQDYVYHQFDNIAVVPVPGALALLGLAGLARRRRRA